MLMSNETHFMANAITQATKKDAWKVNKKGLLLIKRVVELLVSFFGLILKIIADEQSLERFFNM